MLLLTQNGTDAVIKFLSATVQDFEDQSRDDWVSHAEAVALMAEDWEDLVLEVRAIESTTGRAETLTMPRAWFCETKATLSK